MSDNTPTIRVPRDVWNIISDKATSDKVYVVNMRGGSFAEVGVFRHKEEAYKVSCNIIGNYYIGCCIGSYQSTVFKRLLDYLYFQVQPENSVLNPDLDETIEYPKTYEELYKNIMAIVQHEKIKSKACIEVIEKNVI